MTLSASEITKLTVLIDGQPRGRLATTTNTVYRLRKTLREAIGEAADAVVDRAMVCETYGGAEAIIRRVLPQEAPAADPVPTPPAPDALIETDHMGEAEFAAFATKREVKQRRTSAAAALEAAQRGILPTPPDFSAATHARFRGKLEGLIALAERGDIAGLEAVSINPVSSSPKALARYRDLCVRALKARKGA